MHFHINGQVVEGDNRSLLSDSRTRWKSRQQRASSAASKNESVNGTSASSEQQAPLLTLPDELLTIIVEKVLEPTRELALLGITFDSFPGVKQNQLRTLRRTHRCFSNLRFINSHLVAAVKFHVELQELRELNISLARLGPSVRRICLEHNQAWADERPTKEEHWNELNVTTAQINTALAVGQMKAALLEIMKKLPNLCQLQLGTGRGCDHELDTPQIHFNDEDQPPFWNRDLGPFNETILSLGLDCVVAAKLRLKEFSFVLVTNRELAWKEIPGWLTVDLSELETLSILIGFRTHRAPQPQPSAEDDRRFMLQATPNIIDLIKRTAATLQNLSIDYTAFIFGHQLESFPTMSRLSTLKLVDVTIDAHSFDIWLSKCPLLSSLILSDVGIRGGHGFQHWRPFFDAIRKHYGGGQGRRMTINYDISLAWHDNHRMAFEHTIPDAAYEYDEGWWGDQPEQGDIVEMLSNYVSGLGMWSVDPGWRPWRHR